MATSASRPDLEQIDREDEAARGAETFESGDRRGLRGDVAAHRVADTDTADQQRRQPDKRQEQRHPVDQPLQIGRRLAKAADLPARIGEGGARLVCPYGGRRTRRQPQPVAIRHQRAGLDQPGLGERRRRDHDPRAEDQPARGGVGLARDRAADLQRRLADLDRVADLDAEPAEDRRVDDGAENAVAASRAQRREFCAGDSATLP